MKVKACMFGRYSCSYGYALQVTVLQTLADERCMHLMPPLAVAVLPPTAYTTGDSAPAALKQSHQQHQAGAKDCHQLQIVLQELQHGSLLDRCHASNSMIKDLRI